MTLEEERTILSQIEYSSRRILELRKAVARAEEEIKEINATIAYSDSHKKAFAGRREQAIEMWMDELHMEYTNLKDFCPRLIHPNQ